MLFFDITRLISSIKNNYATGIDRVEMNYFLYMVHNQINVKFVFKFRNKMFLARSDLTIKYIYALDKKWKGNLPIDIFNNYKTLHKFRKKIIDTSFINKTIFHKLNIFFNKPLPLDINLINEIKKSKDQPTYLNVSHANIENELFIKAFKSLNMKIVCMLHDLIPITHPHYCTENSTLKHKYRVYNMVKYSDYILSNSNYTEKKLIEYCLYKKLTINSKLIVSPLGTEQFIRNKLDTKRDKRYFITIGTIEPRKNHWILINIWKELILELGNNCPYLYIVGKRGWMNNIVFNELDDLKKITDKVVEINDANDNNLRRLIEEAEALLMPTSIEGWCMPITEALLLDKIVACSDLEVLRESGQNIPIYIPLNDKEKWKHTIINIHEKKYNYKKKTYKAIQWHDHLQSVFNKINT